MRTTARAAGASLGWIMGGCSGFPGLLSACSFGLLAVVLGVSFGGLRSVVRGVVQMSLRHVRVVRREFVVT